MIATDIHLDTLDNAIANLQGDLNQLQQVVSTLPASIGMDAVEEELSGMFDV